MSRACWACKHERLPGETPALHFRFGCSPPYGMGVIEVRWAREDPDFWPAMGEWIAGDSDYYPAPSMSRYYPAAGGGDHESEP